MKKTLITAVALAACAGTQLFAQNTKEGVISFALTANEQQNVTTSNSRKSTDGFWSDVPRYYFATTVKKNTSHVLRAIGAVLYKNGSAFSSKAQLVMVQGELGGFFNVDDTLGDDNGPKTDLALGNDNNGYADVTDFASTRDYINARLATGRHFRPNPITEAWPPGHHQPWGQIFVRDPGASGYSASNPLCVNVTFFFGITVQECYDCWYLSSFVTESKFAWKQGSSPGPGCCGVAADLTGSGKDLYYMTLSFDNTVNNPYLNPAGDAWIGKGTGTLASPNPWYRVNPTAWVVGMGNTGLPGDGLIPDLLGYVDLIHNGLYPFVNDVMRFTLNGIVTYTWTMKKINSTDQFYDFVGTANYPASGYGFTDLVCALFTGSMSIAEKINKNAYCCTDLPWYDSWYGVGWNLFQNQNPLNPLVGDLPDGSYFGSPVNIAEDISLHVGYNEWYESRWMWPQDTGYGTPSPAQPETAVNTIYRSSYESPYGLTPKTRIPSTRDLTDRANTPWPIVP
jgi:hypothetical protein